MRRTVGLRGIVVMLALSLVLATVPTVAQKKGATSTIRLGEVVDRKKVKLKDNSAAKGALIGGAIGLAAGSGKSGKDKRKRTAIGAGAGAAVGSRKKADEGVEYTVKTAEGVLIKIVSDQTQIQRGDCVAVEESGGKANIRRMSQTACEPESKSLMQDPAMQEEMQEEAAECTAAKKELVAAETDEQVDRALRKMSILCDD
jgi:outer membrane lipoprotein SlyB